MKVPRSTAKVTLRSNEVVDPTSGDSVIVENPAPDNAPKDSAVSTLLLPT
jgi:hypothetical protein